MPVSVRTRSRNVAPFAAARVASVATATMRAGAALPRLRRKPPQRLDGGLDALLVEESGPIQTLSQADDF